MDISKLVVKQEADDSNMGNPAVIVKQEIDESNIVKEEQPAVTTEAVISAALHNISLLIPVRSLRSRGRQSLIIVATRLLEAR